MPRPWRVKSLTREMPMPHAAAAILSVKLPEVLHYERKARRGTVDGIHDMRVACKRLREALRVLRPALRASQRAELLPPIEQLNDALGLVRDCDVLALNLNALAEPDAPAEAVSGLLTMLAERRETHHRKLLRLLDELRETDLAGVYEAAGRRLARSRSQSPTVMQFAAQAVVKRLGPVADNLDAAILPVEVEVFHRERIAVKKLKYALELFLTVLPRKARAIYNDIAVLQELMGEVHDQDVLAEVVQLWEEEHGAAPDTAAVLKQVARRREELAAATRDHALAMREARFDVRLAEVMRKATG